MLKPVRYFYPLLFLLFWQASLHRYSSIWTTNQAWMNQRSFAMPRRIVNLSTPQRQLVPPRTACVGVRSRLIEVATVFDSGRGPPNRQCARLSLDGLLLQRFPRGRICCLTYRINISDYPHGYFDCWLAHSSSPCVGHPSNHPEWYTYVVKSRRLW